MEEWEMKRCENGEVGNENADFVSEVSVSDEVDRGGTNTVKWDANQQLLCGDPKNPAPSGRDDIQIVLDQ